MVIIEVAAQDPYAVPLIEHHDKVQAIASEAAKGASTKGFCQKRRGRLRPAPGPGRGDVFETLGISNTEKEHYG